MKKWILFSTLIGIFLSLTGCENEDVTTEETTAIGQSVEGMTNAMYQKVCVQEEEVMGPWQNNLGLTWIDGSGEVEGESEVLLIEAGGVPTVIKDKEGRLIAAFQWFPCDEKSFDKVAVSISEDEGETWSDPELIEIENLPEGYQRPFDPTLALLEDDRIRLYFTSNPNGMTTFSGDTNIYSAISEDGVHYTFEEGERFGLEENPAYDSAVGYWDGWWHIITPQNNEDPHSAYHAISEDGLNFEPQEEILLETEVNWTGNFLAKEDGLYFYGTPNQSIKNWWTMTSDGETWSDAEPMNGNLGGDPAVVCIEEDRCLTIAVQMSTNAGTMPPPIQ